MPNIVFPHHALLLYSLNVLELCILVSDIVVGSFLTLIAFQASMFHRNLSFLFVGLYGMASVAILTQTALAIAGFYEFDILAQENLFIREGWSRYLEWVRIGACGGILSFFSSIIVERALATKMLRTYELEKNNGLLVASFLVAFAVASLGSTVVMIKVEWIPYIASIGIVASAFLGFLFFYSYELNKRRYRDTQRHSQLPFSLSERFQLQENIRSMTIMKKCVFVISVGNVVILIVLGLQFAKVTGVQFLMRKAVNILVAIYALIFNYVAIKNVPAWSRIANRMIWVLCFRRAKKVWDARTNSLENIKSFSGKPLVFTIEKEREVYFNQLQDSWNQ